MADTYKEVKVFNFPNIVVRVHFPDIEADERERRLNIIKKAAAELLKK